MNHLIQTLNEYLPQKKIIKVSLYHFRKLVMPLTNYREYSVIQNEKPLHTFIVNSYSEIANWLFQSFQAEYITIGYNQTPVFTTPIELSFDIENKIKNRYNNMIEEVFEIYQIYPEPKCHELRLVIENLTLEDYHPGDRFRNCMGPEIVEQTIEKMSKKLKPNPVSESNPPQ